MVKEDTESVYDSGISMRTVGGINMRCGRIGAMALAQAKADGGGSGGATDAIRLTRLTPKLQPPRSTTRTSSPGNTIIINHVQEAILCGARPMCRRARVESCQEQHGSSIVCVPLLFLDPEFPFTNLRAQISRPWVRGEPAKPSKTQDDYTRIGARFTVCTVITNT